MKMMKFVNILIVIFCPSTIKFLLKVVWKLNKIVGKWIRLFHFHVQLIIYV